MTSWIVVIRTYENWLKCREIGLLGFPRDLSDKLCPNDLVAVYCSEVRAFVAVCRIASDWFREDVLLWPDETREGKVKYPYRVKVEILREGRLPIYQILDKLSFIRPEHVQKKQWGIYFRMNPANFRKPIPEQDLQLILENLR